MERESFLTDKEETAGVMVNQRECAVGWRCANGTDVCWCREVRSFWWCSDKKTVLCGGESGVDNA